MPSSGRPAPGRRTMAAKYLENLRALAERCADRDTTLYFPDFDTDPGPGSLNGWAARRSAWTSGPGLASPRRR